jgi:hypothetical protein
MEDSLSLLSSQQRYLILQVTVHQRKFEDLEEELALDTDMIAEQYDEILAILREAYQ